MSRIIIRIVSAWQLVVKRSLSNWRLLSSVVLGVVLASAIMSGTVVYFDALRELALKQALEGYETTKLDVLMMGRSGPTNRSEYAKVTAVVEGSVDARLAWLVTDRIRAGKSPTLFLTQPGKEEQAGDDDARALLAFLPRLGDHSALREGGRPPIDYRFTEPGETPEVEALVPADAALMFEIGVGERFSVVPSWDSLVPFITVIVTGIVDRSEPADEAFWHLESLLKSNTAGSFRTLPFYVTERSYLESLGPMLPRMDSFYAWLLPVDMAVLTAGNADAALAQLDANSRELASTLASFRQTTALNEALREYDRRLFFNKLPMFVVLILISFVIVYYVVTLSSLVVEERRGEIALLRSRGASSDQILTVFVIEGANIAVLAVLVGPLLAAFAVGSLGFTPAFSDTTGGAALAVSISSGAYLMSALGGVLSFAALLIPAVQASRIGVTRHRQHAARPNQTPAFQRYYVDVLLLLLGILVFRQLTEQGSVLASNVLGEVAVNQVLLALPALILVASAMVLLRLFPVAMNLASRLMSSWLPAGVVMSVWQMARNPTHYARLSLLLILTAGLGIFASSFGATLQRSFQERVLYSVGTDVRVDGVHPVLPTSVRSRWRRAWPRPTFTPTPVPLPRPALVSTFQDTEGVGGVSPVLRAPGQVLTGPIGQTFVMLAVDSGSFNDVAWLREDFSDRPVRALLSDLDVSATASGLPLSYEARTVSVRVKADRPHPTVRLSARIRNAQGHYSTHNLGNLDSSEWTVVQTRVNFGEALADEPDAFPSLVSIRVHETGAERRLQGGSILIDEVWTASESGASSTVLTFADASGWSVLEATPDAVSDVIQASGLGSNGDSRSLQFTWTSGSPQTLRGIYYGAAPSRLPVVASKEFARSTGFATGEEFEISVLGHRFLVRLAGTVDLFPTMTNLKDRYLVADIAPVSRLSNVSAMTREVRPNEMWIATEAQASDRATLVRSLMDDETYRGSSIHDSAERLAEAKVDPLVEAGWRALLFIAFATVLILSCLGFTVHAYVSFRSRQLQFALLRTIGLSLRQLMTMVWLEQTIVIAVGLALGTWMGGRLGATIMPFLGHDDWGDQVVPPFAIVVNWSALLLTYAAMLIVFGIISLALVWLIQKISLQRILRLGEM